VDLVREKREARNSAARRERERRAVLECDEIQKERKIQAGNKERRKGKTESRERERKREGVSYVSL
jgi:hypothetical protein